MKPGDNPSVSPIVLAWLLAPLGIFVIAIGLHVGITGELQGRGATMQLGDTWGWVIGGLMIVLGGMIVLSPLYYHLRGRAERSVTDATDGPGSASQK
jgi:hypothetical protein